MIKKFADFINENKYPNVNIDGGGGDHEHALVDDTERLDIIKKYFPFSNVEGYTKWEEGLVDLTFDNGAMFIKGKYDTENDTMPANFIIGDESYVINWHPWGQMGSIDLLQFEEEIKNVKESIGKWTLSLHMKVMLYLI